jgi:hypothetical protein
MKLLTAAALFLPMALATGAPATKTAPSAPDADSRIEHGRYLVPQVALCVQCHSPRDENGRLLETRLLSGARIPVSSPFPSQPWAYQAPDIRGMVGYTDEEGIRLLTEGITRGGTPPRPPMQQFHLTVEDARAVVAYLKSLR